jgi:hypothetical protein
MNKMARKLVLSILTVVLTLVALGTTTFAWFTLTNIAVVQPFNAKVVTETGIEIAIAEHNTPADQLVWFTQLTAARINDYIDAKYNGNFEFDAVTSQNGRDFYGFAMPGDIPAITTSGWLSLHLHFRSTTSSAINWTEVSLTANDYTWTSGTPFTTSKGLPILANGQVTVNPADAFRISITGLVNDLTNTVTYENAVSDTNTVLGGLSEVNLQGANGAQNYYFQSTTQHAGGSDSVTTVATITTLSANRVVDLSTALTELYPVEYYTRTYYGRVIVRVWFEGWDAEGYNALLGRMVTTSFRFTGVTI